MNVSTDKDEGKGPVKVADTSNAPSLIDDTELPSKLGFFSLFKFADKVDYVLMTIGAVGAVVSGACLPAFCIVFGQFMDTFGDPPSGSEFKKKVALLASYFIYLAVGSFIASYVETAFWSWTGNRQTNRIRALYLQSVLRQDISFFDVHSTTGGLLSGLSEDSLVIQQATSEKVGAFLHHSTTFLAGFGIAFWKGWDLALVMLGCLPFLGLVGGVLLQFTMSASQKVQEAYSQANGIAQQAISQIRTVAANGQEEQTIREYDESLEPPYKVAVKLSVMNGLSLGSLDLVLFGAYAGALYYGAWRVSHNVLGGYYTGGDVMAVVIAAIIGGFSVGQASPNLAFFAKGVSAARKVFGVIERKPKIDIEAEGRVLPAVEGAIELHNITFAYPARPDVTIFTDFSLSIPGGKTVALVGGSGSGKSTVVQLVERFYDPIKGQVLLDGVDLRQLQLRWLRSQVGLVSQEPTLFATTIFENIAMGCPGATAEEVQAAAVAANAHRFIASLPLKYDTHAGERGLQLSGGQKQRIAIARAILKNPRVLLLDEATSALDTESERVVQEALDRMVVGRTTLVVAHRLSTVQGADRIAVVQAGAVVEQGTHSELLRNPTGVYTALVQVQMQAARQEAITAPSAPALGGGVDGAVAPGGGPKVEAVGEVEEVGEKVAAAGSDKEGAAVNKDAPLEVVVVVDPSAKEEDGGEAGAKAAAEATKAGKKGLCGGAPKEKKGKEAEEVVVPLSRLLKYNAPEWPFAVVGVIASGVRGAVQPLFALILVSVIIALFDPDKSKIVGKVSFFSWMFLVVGVASLVAAAVQQYCFGLLGQTLARRIRRLMLRSIMYQEIAFFDHPSNPSSTLIKKLSEDTTYIRGAVGDSLGVITQNLLCLAVGYLIALYYDWRMALLVTGAVPLLVVAMVLQNSYLMGATSATSKLYDAANQTVTDAFTSARAIHAYNLQEPICALYQKLMAPGNKATTKSSHITGLCMGYSQFMVYALYALVIWFGGEEVASGRADFKEMMMAFVAVLLAAMGIAQAQIGFPDMAKAKSAIQHVFPILDRQSAIDASSQEGEAPAKGAQGAIELRDVSFVYPSRAEVMVFQGFSLSIPAGQTVALVGESGSGKSTVVALIERFYDPLAGTLLLDGRDLRSYQVKWLRAQMALVSQEPLLFSRSIVDNIRYGSPDATQQQVEAAARAANAHDFIEGLPEKYHTQVGEQGIQLSGGQKQRIAIARAVIKNPAILLLDEATSALDAASESIVQQALDKIMVGRTCVVVAHRLSTIRSADCIALVHRGAILERGTHEELMRRPQGGYAKLVAAQMAPRNGGSSGQLAAQDVAA